MGKVLTFWWHPDEEEAFLTFLMQSGPIVAVPFERATTQNELRPHPFCKVMSANLQHLCFTPLEFSQKIVAKQYVDNTGAFSVISAMKSPVIVYSRVRFSEPNVLATGNLNYYVNYPNDDGTRFITHPPEFVRWAHKVFRWVRKATPESHDKIRMSARIHKEWQDGLIELTAAA